jgi:hypothetical protein
MDRSNDRIVEPDILISSCFLVGVPSGPHSRIVIDRTNGLPEAGWPYLASAVATGEHERRDKARFQFSLWGRVGDVHELPVKLRKPPNRNNWTLTGDGEPDQGPDANDDGRVLASSSIYPIARNVSISNVQVIPNGKAFLRFSVLLLRRWIRSLPRSMTLARHSVITRPAENAASHMLGSEITG